MTEMKYCICCGSPICWISDWDARNDYNLEHDGVVGLNLCSSTKCGANIEIRELAILSEDREEISIKYYNDSMNDLDTEIDCVNTIVDRCLYCGETLEFNGCNSVTIENDEETLITNKLCPKCNTGYRIEDLYNIEEEHSEKKFCLDIYDSRTITIE